jgi:hypothetical protein
MDTEHTEHVHCLFCNCCMHIPITILVDTVLDSRKDGIDVGGLICDYCL